MQTTNYRLFGAIFIQLVELDPTQQNKGIKFVTQTITQHPIISIILSGGTGSRLWPVSRESHPKPFILLPDGQSLLQKAFVRAITCPNIIETLTITNAEYYFKSKAEYDQLVNLAKPKLSYLLEPCARNTAPAILLAALKIEAEHGRNAIMLVLPADHLITDVAAFHEHCNEAFALAASGKLVTFGIKPTRPETGFGYIECGTQINPQPRSRLVKRFVEKPNLATAQEYLASGQYLWNAGMFCFQVGTLLDEFQSHAPDLLAAAQTCWSQGQQSEPDAVSLNETAFKQLESISIDYAIMEKSNNIAVVACDYDWQDIGSWDAYKNLFPSDQNGNAIVGTAITIDSNNNFIQSDGRMIAAIGINDLALIDTPDALLITHRNRTQDVKDIVQTLKKNAHESYMTHRTVIRPWGSYTVLEEGPCFKIKRIVVKPKASLSLQLHHQRSEHWVVVSGTAQVTIAEKTFQLQTNESTFVPIGTPHRLSNPGDCDVVMIEVQTGAYLGEDDIVRLEDIYGRKTITREEDHS